MDDPKVTVEVGGDLRSFAADVATRWRAASAGAPVEPSRRIVFRDWAAVYATLTPKRMELLAQLHAAPAAGVRPLARLLERDVKRVHKDVVALEELGLISRSETGAITIDVEEIQSIIRIGSATPFASAT